MLQIKITVPMTFQHGNKKMKLFLQKCSRCLTNSLDPNLVKGKIVLCDVANDGVGQFIAGAVGTVMQNQGPTTLTPARAYPLPASRLSLQNGGDIYSYINSTRY